MNRIKPTQTRLAALLIAFVSSVTLSDAWSITSTEPSSAPDPTYALTGAALVTALRAGGYTLYFRHTSTDFAKLDGKMKSYQDCENQRMLSERGRTEARDVGKAIVTLQLPIGEVLASPFCRTTETAMLMFGRATGANEIREESGNNYAALKRLLAKPVSERGLNRMIVGHGTPFRAIAGPPHLSEGEAAVLKPMGASYSVVARITLDDWPSLIEAANKVEAHR